MKVDPHIIDGPKYCGACETSCHHEPTMQWLGIYFVLDDGTEMGQACMTTLEDGELSDFARKHMEYGLWREYEKWAADESST